MVADLGVAPALRSPPYRKFLVQRGNVISQLPKDRWAGAGSMTKLQHLIDIVLNHGKDLCRYMEKMSVIRAKTRQMPRTVNQQGNKGYMYASAHFCRPCLRAAFQNPRTILRCASRIQGRIFPYNNCRSGSYSTSLIINC